MVVVGRREKGETERGEEGTGGGGGGAIGQTRNIIRLTHEEALFQGGGVKWRGLPTSKAIRK